MAYVLIKFANSPRPDLWVLERSTDFGHTYQPWQFFACECPGARAGKRVPGVAVTLLCLPHPASVGVGKAGGASQRQVGASGSCPCHGARLGPRAILWFPLDGFTI